MSSSEQMTYHRSDDDKCRAQKIVYQSKFHKSLFRRREHWWTDTTSGRAAERGMITFFAQHNSDLRGVPAGSYRLAKRAYKNEIRKVKKKLSGAFTIWTVQSQRRQFWRKWARNAAERHSSINDESCAGLSRPSERQPASRGTVMRDNCRGSWAMLRKV
jgi:hypothetical protein